MQDAGGKFHLWITRDVDWNLKFFVHCHWLCHISSLDYQRCGLKLSKGENELMIQLFHLWITRDVDWNRSERRAYPHPVGFHLWITRDVDWNVGNLLENPWPWNFISGLPEMWIETSLRKWMINFRFEFHLWITRDVDWNICVMRCPSLIAYFISGLPEMWIETSRLPAVVRRAEFHLWITRDVDWNWSVSIMRIIKLLFHLWITRDVDWNVKILSSSP